MKGCDYKNDSEEDLILINVESQRSDQSEYIANKIWNGQDSYMLNRQHEVYKTPDHRVTATFPQTH